VIPADSLLIARCLTLDDTAAFGELVLRHQSVVRRFLRHLTRGDAARADDLAQDTFVRAYRGLDGFRGESRFEVWLLGIAYNRFRNSSRQVRRENPAPETDLDALAAPESGRLEDLRHDIASALGRISADEQLALRMSFQVGLSHGEIAAALGWPVGTVKTRIARGKERLRELLLPWKVSP
jgi:RNA polymerase sigma-70 factor (ECF subfamily)